MIKIVVGSNTFYIPLVDGSPIWSGFDSSVIAQLQSAYDSDNYQLIPAFEPQALSPVTSQVRSIDMRRLRLALLQMELLDGIDAAIAAQSKAAQIEWEFATDVKADHPLVGALATAMSLDIDAIFDLAESFT